MKLAGDSRAIGVCAGSSAVLLGLGYMWLAGAPLRLLLMNLAALGIGLALFQLVRMLAPHAATLRGPVLTALSIALLAASLGGLTVYGATRWVGIIGITVQPSLIVAPLLVTAYAARPDRWSAAALAVAVLSVALQPDRSVAAMLLLGSLVVILGGRDKQSLALGAMAAAGLAVTLLRPDALPAIPYVDQILYTSFDADPLAGLCVWTGTTLLFAPMLALVRGRGFAAEWAFAAVWAGAVLAASLGNYPTPLVGYGGSAIIGYMLSLIPLGMRETAAATSPVAIRADREEDEQNLRFA